MDSTEPKRVVAPDKADEPAQPKKQIFRFEKQQIPGETVTLRNGQKIKFRLKEVARNGFASVSTYETDDVNLAGLIRAAAKNPQWSIVEKN